MKSNRVALVLTLFLTLCIAPAYGANKDIIELQTQVTQLQQQMTQMKQSFDERMGVMRNLLEQNTDAANKVSAAINGLQTSVNKQQQDRAGQVDQISGQIQAQQQAQAMAQAPAPDVLYNNALRDYNGGKNDLAVQEFNDYIKFYPNTDLAGNAYFYVAEIQFKAGDYQKAVANYDLVLQNFPSGNKAAVAQLKKGYALLELGKEDEGTQELKHVIQRYPRTNEAVQARERLRKVGPATPKSR